MTTRSKTNIETTSRSLFPFISERPADRSIDQIRADNSKLIALSNRLLMVKHVPSTELTSAEELYMPSLASSPDNEDGWVSSPEAAQQLVNERWNKAAFTLLSIMNADINEREMIISPAGLCFTMVEATHE